MAAVVETRRFPALRRTRRRGRVLPGRRAAYAYIAPFFVVFAAFSVYPWLDTAWVSFHNVRLSTYNNQTWVGLGNYRNLFGNTFFWNALKNTVTIGILATVPQLCMALGLAHLLNYKMRGSTFFRVAMLMPYATSLAAAAIIFLQLFDKDIGFINFALHPRRPAPGGLAGVEVAQPGRGRRHRHLALDRLQRVDLPGRHAGHRLVTVRGCRYRWRRAVEAIPQRHRARIAPNNPLHHRRLDHRSLTTIR